MEDRITDPPTPDEQAETERLAGELLKEGDTLRWALSEVDRLRDEIVSLVAGRYDDDDEAAALRAKVADLSLALAREAQLTDKLGRERDEALALARELYRLQTETLFYQMENGPRVMAMARAAGISP